MIPVKNPALPLYSSVEVSSRERIRKMFGKVELSPSAYDTAWVSMVSLPGSPGSPRFPQSIQWIVDNQLDDGSWGLANRPPSFVKDALSSTLACVLALKQWGIAEQLIDKGLSFIESNSSNITDHKQHDPIGFDVIFSSMIEHGRRLNLNIPLKVEDVDAVFARRSSVLQSGNNSPGKNAFLAFVSEGMAHLQDWDIAKTFKRKNGSLFNSPSATASACQHLQDLDCLSYLDSVVHEFGGAVPAIYPLHIYSRLGMIDTLERLGIERHFRKEIELVLDDTYRCWQQEDDEIFLDLATCAMAFRILRQNGYSVSADLLIRCIEDCFVNSLDGYMKDSMAVLELFRATQLCYTDEPLLEEYNLWATHVLKTEFSAGAAYCRKPVEFMASEVHDAMRFPDRADLQRLTSKRTIEKFRAESIMISKTSFRCQNLGNQDMRALAVEDFNFCQSLHRDEVGYLGRWIEDMKLDKLQFARQKLSYCFFSAAATLFAPELTDARISWAKNGVLTTIVDDFYDVGGSDEELLNLVQLIDKWDIDWKSDFISEKVEIIFSAIHNTVREIAERALPRQGRDVTTHIVNIWLDLVKSMWKETQLSKMNITPPSYDEYITNARVSFALGPIVLPALYLVGPELSEELINSHEFDNLFTFLSTCGRLLNDWRSYERELKEGKLNAMSLLMNSSAQSLAEAEAVEKMKKLIYSYRVKLQEMVFGEKGGQIPIMCRNLFWNMMKVLHVFYANNDGFTANELMDVAHAVIKSPIN